MRTPAGRNISIPLDHISVGRELTTAAPPKGIADKRPLHLQDHGNPVRFRNVWVRPL